MATRRAVCNNHLLDLFKIGLKQQELILYIILIPLDQWQEHLGHLYHLKERPLIYPTIQRHLGKYSKWQKMTPGTKY